MAAGRDPVNTVTGELLRQSDRIVEQYDNLQRMLRIISQLLENMENKTADVSRRLSSSMRDLRLEIDDYCLRSSRIYGKLAYSLKTYADQTNVGLEELTDKVVDVSQNIEGL